MKTRRQIPLELAFWITALVLLALAQPQVNPLDHHFTFCPLANLGFEWCPGCGVGRAITELFHGNLRRSLAQHWFGVPALMILFYRIGVLSRQFFNAGNGINLVKKEKDYV